MPWAALFYHIRSESLERTVTVYDAACGFGDILNQLTAAPLPKGLRYVGADIHNALGDIAYPSVATLTQWDITQPLPGAHKFDFIVCRAAIHHTPDPEATFKVLVEQLKPGGTIAITAYARKGPMREATDDALRSKIVPMSNDEAFEIANQLTNFGRDLKASNGTVVISADIPFLGIKSGTYYLQAFIYSHFIKCWFNPAFSEKHCDLINFDWYHPPYAYRYDVEDLRRWAMENSLTVVKEASTEAQHYMQCELK